MAEIFAEGKVNIVISKLTCDIGEICGWYRYLLMVFRDNYFFLKSMHHFCGMDWEKEIADNSFYREIGDPYYFFHLRYILALFSLASTEGSDTIAYIPSTVGHYCCMVFSVIIGMFVLAFINAKLTSHYTALILPISQIIKDIESMHVLMKQQKVCQSESEEVINYLEFVFLETNRVTLPQMANLLYSIPPRVRITGKQLEIVSKQSFFQQPSFSQHLIEKCRSLYIPPKTYLFRSGDLFLGYFIIKKGHCLVIDLLGNCTVRGPGDSVGLLSIWVGAQVTTAISHTYLHVDWISSSVFVKALQKCPRERCRFEYAYMMLEDRFLIIHDVLTEKGNMERHDEDVSMENLSKTYVFTNYPEAITLADRSRKR